MIPLGMSNPQGTRTQGARGPWKPGCSGDRRAGNFEQNLPGGRQGAADGHQRAAGADVQRRRELKEFLALIVPAADKHGDRKRKARPLSTISVSLASDQRAPRKHSFPAVYGI